MTIEIKVPEVGESVYEVEIAEWYKQEGDTVEQDENLVQIETDKATVELPSPSSGVISKILKKTGEIVPVGEVIAQLDEQPAEERKKAEPTKREEPAEAQQRARQAAPAGAQVKEEKAEGEREEAAAPPLARISEDTPGREPATQEEEAEESGERPWVVPSARRALARYGLQAEEVEATGPGGRLLEQDVLRHVEQQKQREAKAEPEPAEGEEQRAARDGRRKAAPPPVPSDEEEVVPMSLIRRRIAQRLVEAQRNAALLTTFNEIDMTEVIALRKRYRDAFQAKYDIKLGFMSFFVKAVVESLKETPALNAQVRSDQHVVYRNYYHIGIAIGGGKGLVVPVVRNAQRLSFAQIEQAIDQYAKRAQENKLKPDELQGGTFTITNGGIYGSLLSTPIVNPPESGVLGMHAIVERPVAHQGQVVIRPMMYVALTYDHRLVDGREAVTFLRRVKEIVEEPARMLIEV